MIPQLISIIEKVKEKLTDESEMVWTSYETAGELREELEKFIAQLKAGNKDCLDNLNMHFLPTATFQEHSLTNSWADEYLKLAEKFDRIYKAIKK